MQKLSRRKGMCIVLILIELFDLLCTCCVCIYSCVPASGYIAPAVYRSRFGPFLPYWDSVGDPVRARAGHLQPRGTFLPAEYSLNRILNYTEIVNIDAYLFMYYQ